MVRLCRHPKAFWLVEDHFYTEQEQQYAACDFKAEKAHSDGVEKQLTEENEEEQYAARNENSLCGHLPSSLSAVAARETDKYWHGSNRIDDHEERHEGG